MRVRRVPPALAIGLLVAAFAARLAFGLCSELFGPDELQIFLIGLQFFTTGRWPYFGPDVVYTHTRIPGALQGLLIGGPMFLAPVPEAAYVVVNVLSMAAFSLLAWYIGRRLPDVPRWILWGWILFAPWTVDVSTHMLNTSFLIPGAVLVFVGAFEITPQLRAGVLGPALAFFMMGFGLAWVYQLHLSFSLLAVVAAAAIVLFAWRQSWTALARPGAAFSVGALIVTCTVIPTWWRYGAKTVLGTMASNIAIEPANVLRVPEIVARFLSFASFEIARFAGPDTPSRLQFLRDYWWAAPFATVAALMGVVQVISLLAGFFIRDHRGRGWTAVKAATAAVIALLCVSFTLSVKDPASHTFYATMPLAMIYAFTCWAPLLRSRRGRALAATLLVCGAVTHVALAMRNVHRRSLYTDRARVMQAIEARDYRILGERRDTR